MELILKRTYFNDATIGTLSILDEDNPIWHTLELPNLGNQKKISCIPEGVYSVITHESPTHKNVWKVENVEDRTDILFHIGNWASDTKGCILVGMSGGYIHQNGKPAKAVRQSRSAFRNMKNVLGYPSSFQLLITS